MKIYARSCRWGRQEKMWKLMKKKMVSQHKIRTCLAYLNTRITGETTVIHLGVMHWSRTILIERSETTLIKGNYSPLERWIFPRHQRVQRQLHFSQTVVTLLHSSRSVCIAGCTSEGSFRMILRKLAAANGSNGILSCAKDHILAPLK